MLSAPEVAVAVKLMVELSGTLTVDTGAESRGRDRLQRGAEAACTA